MRRLMIWLMLITVFGGMTAVFATLPSRTLAGDPPPLQSIPLEALLLPEAPAAPDAPVAEISPGADQCAAATVVSLSDATNSFGSTTYADTLEQAAEISDPVLSCALGSPGGGKGYRTAWYVFTAPENGTVQINAFQNPDDYDTIISVHTGSCETLVEVACNDDYNGLLSGLTLAVQKDVTYYIEVADWNQAKPGRLRLDFVLELQPIDTVWEKVDPTGFAPDRTRHATAVNGNDIYLVGGQDGGTPNTLSRDLFRLETTNNRWVSLPPMPGDALEHHTAVFLEDKLYVAGGSNSIDGDQFVDTHKVYDATNNVWLPNGASTPYAVGWAQAVESPNGNGYYLVGGISAGDLFSDTAQARNEVWFYDLAADNWSDQAPMPAARYGHTAAWVNDGICVVGGIEPPLIFQSKMDCFQPGGSGTWREIANGTLNIPRYGAGSIVTPDNRWYIFGGTTVDAGNQHVAVSTVEFFDFKNGEAGWQILPVRYDLGGSDSIYPRAWVQTEFVNSHVYAVGGNDTSSATGFFVTPLVQRLFVPQETVNLPFFSNEDLATRFDNNFALANNVGLNIPVNGQFEGTADFFDMYKFSVSGTGPVTMLLTGIPSGKNYDLTIYDSNKTFLGEGINGGTNDEVVTLNLSAGTYYVLIEKIYTSSSSPATFRFEVRR